VDGSVVGLAGSVVGTVGLVGFTMLGIELEPESTASAGAGAGAIGAYEAANKIEI
jgi:hypothetical protein